jgi:PKD repeat protein
MIRKQKDIILVIVLMLITAFVWTTAVLSVDLQITWNPNDDWDLAGYNISYDGPSSARWNTSCAPYEHSSMGVSEYTTSFLIEDAQAGNYAFFVRAFDSFGNMSDYEPYAGHFDGEDTWTTQGVSEPTNCVPVATIVVASTSGLTPLTLNFAGSSTNNPTSWHWDFGDGTTSDVQNPGDHTYTLSQFVNSMTYRLELKVENDNWFDREIMDIIVNRSMTLGSGCSGTASFH